MYYSEEDRAKAATRRRLNSQFKQVMKSPEDVYDIFGISVPRVSHKPALNEYGLTDDAEEHLKQIDQEYIHKEKSSRITKAIIFTAIAIGIFIYFQNLSNPILHPENYDGRGRLINNAVAYGGGAFFLLGFYGFIWLWTQAFDVKPKETCEHTQFKKYKEQLSYFEYWERKNTKEHWNNMAGHSFEQAIANLFRNIGFNAEVSKSGGDGGVDIILQKGDRKIAVQCKRYKSSVGPHVIRDLWGTMNYLGINEGCIVTTTGFTKGVTSFAQEKHIFLIDLDDILKATNKDGDAYLSRQIGEL